MNVWWFGKWRMELRHRGWAAVLRVGTRNLWSQQVPLHPIKGRCQVGPGPDLKGSSASVGIGQSTVA